MIPPRPVCPLRSGGQGLQVACSGSGCAWWYSATQGKGRCGITPLVQPFDDPAASDTARKPPARPLADSLGSGWLLLAHPRHEDDVVVLHRDTGAWVEIAFADALRPDEVKAIVEALNTFGPSTQGGRYVVVTKRNSSGVTAWPERLQEPA